MKRFSSKGQVIATNKSWFSWDESSHGYYAYVSLDGDELYFELESEDRGDFTKSPVKTIFDGRIGTLINPDYSKINSLFRQYHIESNRAGYNWSKKWKTPQGHELSLADIVESYLSGVEPSSKLLDFDDPQFVKDLKDGIQAHTVQIEKQGENRLIVTLFWIIDSERRMKDLGPKFTTNFTKVSLVLMKTSYGVTVSFDRWTTSYKTMKNDRKPPSKQGFTTTKEIIKFINTYYNPKSDYVYAASRIAERIVGRIADSTINRLKTLIEQNNASYGTKFSLGNAYSQWELWAELPNGGDERIESGSPKEVYNAFVKVRFNSKYKKASVADRVSQNVIASWDLKADNVPRPPRMKKPIPTSGAHRVYTLYIQDLLHDILVDKYGDRRGEENFEYFANKGGGAFYAVGQQIQDEKAQMYLDLGEHPPHDYFAETYFDVWKRWMARPQG